MDVSAELLAALRDIANTFDESWTEGCLERMMGDKARAAIARASAPAPDYAALVERLLYLYQAEPEFETLKEAADAITALSAGGDGVPEGYRLVPEAALKWLNGEGPGLDGRWFGDDRDKFADRLGKYWWRRVFFAMLTASPRNEGGRQRERDSLAKQVAGLTEALRNIAEGNLGPAPWQANYEKIRSIARAALKERA